MKNVVWTKGTSGLEGEFQSASEVDFYIDKVSTNKHFEFWIYRKYLLLNFSDQQSMEKYKFYILMKFCVF